MTGCPERDANYPSVIAELPSQDLYLIRYWLTREAGERFEEKVNDINMLYKLAPELAQKGEAVMSTDNLRLSRREPHVISQFLKPVFKAGSALFRIL